MASISWKGVLCFQISCPRTGGGGWVDVYGSDPSRLRDCVFIARRDDYAYSIPLHARQPLCTVQWSSQPLQSTQ